MAFNKKYAGLPDLDLAPDIYETPDLTDEASTVQTGTVRTASNIDTAFDSDIDQDPVNADEARAHFLGATVDARHVNFSDSIAIKRKSYRSKSRQRRKDVAEGEDSEDETESLERKLARLQREVEELKDELAAQKPEESNEGLEENKGDMDDGVEKLSRALDSLYASSRGASQPHSAAALISQKLASPPSTQPSQASAAQPQLEVPNNEAEPTDAAANILSHTAAFDARLALLESAMGISTSSNPFTSEGSLDAPLQPVLPALDHLTSRLSTLMTLLVGPNALPAAATTHSIPASSTTTAATTPHLELLSARVRKLTADADALASARKRVLDSSKAAQSSRLARTTSDLASPGGIDPEQAAAQRDEQTTKIQALYAALPTIQSLHPILPSVLERLRSLRAIHAGAAQAAENLDELEKRQAEMAGEIEQWREGLKVVEEKMGQGEAALKSNIEVVEPWVRDLEKRMEKLEGGN
ncbi:dynactin subunit 2 [Aspergillus stella-maris]|uniref:dynactin subunit 2 n=1 Tax=Aspergillus stella-maris TaxID=1810926 RepID=UPI003CCD508E